MTNTERVLRIAVAGATGESGKTMLAVNLAVAVAAAGKKVVLIDADPQAPMVHRHLGIEMPPRNLQSFFGNEVSGLYDAVVPSGIPRTYLVAGWARDRSQVLKPAHRMRLLRHAGRLGAQVVIFDCGSRANPETLDIFNLCDYRIMTVTSEPTSVRSAYSLIKASAVRLLDQTASSSDDIALINRFLLAGGTLRLRESIDGVQQHNPEFAAALRHAISNYRVGLFVNRVNHTQTEGVGFALSRLVQDYLAFEPELIGDIFESPLIDDSCQRGRPFLADSIYCIEGEGIRRGAEIALKLTGSFDTGEAPPEADWGQTIRPQRPVATDSTTDAIRHYMRRHERVPTRWRARIHVEDASSPPGEGDLLDISIGGAAVATQLDVTPGQQVTLWLVDHEDQPQLSAVVRHIHRRGGYRIGLEFVGTDSMRVALDLATEAKTLQIAEEKALQGDDDESASEEANSDVKARPPVPPAPAIPSLFSQVMTPAPAPKPTPEGPTTAPPPAIFPYKPPSAEPMKRAALAAKPAPPPVPPAIPKRAEEEPLDLSAFDEPRPKGPQD